MTQRSKQRLRMLFPATSTSKTHFITKMDLYLCTKETKCDMILIDGFIFHNTKLEIIDYVCTALKQISLGDNIHI